ncbi:MAG: hypothetical protein J7J46_10215, partial [Candidatus Desulfofervidus sp.]|nr:hypothetical protein [Candidatus Desulfofervidus sp.]
KKEPMYFIAITSDKEIDISKHALRSYLTDVDNTIFDNFRGHIQRLEGEVAEVRKTITQKDERIKDLEGEINKILQLKSVRLHRKIEDIKKKLRIRQK